jgi:ribosomal protein L11 methyltransferase
LSPGSRLTGSEGAGDLRVPAPDPGARPPDPEPHTSRPRTPLAPPDRWLVLTVRIRPDDPLRDLLGEGLLALGGLSVLEEAEGLTTYLPPPADPDAYVEEAGHFLGEWIADEPPVIEWSWQANEDWEREWRRGLRPRQLTDRIVVKPSWTAWEARPDQVVIEIDPQMAFGTGEHATTRGCLRLLDSRVGQGARVLDLGSGTAILSIAAARLGAREVIAVEYDPDANINAVENIERNAVADRVSLREQMADVGLIGSLGPFDLVLANILSSVIRPLLPALATALAPGGHLIVSGILQSERDTVLADAERVGLRLDDEDAEEEWWSGALSRGAGDRAPS